MFQAYLADRMLATWLLLFKNSQAPFLACSADQGGCLEGLPGELVGAVLSYIEWDISGFTCKTIFFLLTYTINKYPHPKVASHQTRCWGLMRWRPRFPLLPRHRTRLKTRKSQNMLKKRLLVLGVLWRIEKASRGVKRRRIVTVDLTE